MKDSVDGLISRSSNKRRVSSRDNKASRNDLIKGNKT